MQFHKKVVLQQNLQWLIIITTNSECSSFTLRYEQILLPFRLIVEMPNENPASSYSQHYNHCARA